MSHNVYLELCALVEQTNTTPKKVKLCMLEMELDLI
jgi:hypothetical protein